MESSVLISALIAPQFPPCLGKEWKPHKPLAAIYLARSSSHVVSIIKVKRLYEKLKSDRRYSSD